MSKVSGGIPDKQAKSAVRKLILAKQGNNFYPGIVMYPTHTEGMLNVYFFSFKEIRRIFVNSLIYNLTDMVGGDVSFMEKASGTVGTGRMEAVKEHNANVHVLVCSKPNICRWLDISEIFVTADQQEPAKF